VTDRGAALRVLFVSKFLHGGGAERQLRLLIEGAARLGVEPAVVIFEGPDAAPDFPARIFRARRAAALDPRPFRDVRGAVREFRPDVVYAWLPESATIPALAAAWRAATPAVLARRNTKPVRGARGLVELIWAALTVRRVIANSPQDGTGLLNEWLFRKTAGVVIPNGFEPAGEVAAPRDPPVEPLRVLSVGRLVRPKNVECILRALAVCDPSRVGSLTVCGGGRRLRRLRRLADRLGIAHRTRFLGPRDDVPRCMAEADVLVHASRFEGMPNVVLEAMAAGLPCVLSNIPAHRQLADGAPMFFDPDRPEALAARLHELATRHDTWACMSRAGPRMVAGLTVERMAVRQVEVLRAVASSRQP